jgi:histidine triad (HIT) family protein
MAEECIFCRIVASEVPSEIIYQDEDFLAFRDISPQAPKHVLIIPKTHITYLAELTEGQQDIAGRLIILAKNLAEKEGIAKSGYRLAKNYEDFNLAINSSTASSGVDAPAVIPTWYLPKSQELSTSSAVSTK